MPFCAGMKANRQFYSFDAQAGRAAVLILTNVPNAPRLHSIVAALVAHHQHFDKFEADLILLAPFGAAPAVFESGPAADYGVDTIVSHNGLFEACGLCDETVMIIVIDRATRVMMSWRADDWSDFPDLLVVETVRRIAREPSIACALPAPLLAIPALLGPSLCQNLIERFNSMPTFESGVTGSSPEGQPQHRVDHARKRRRDLMLFKDDDLREAVAQRISCVCFPEIRRAFQHDVSHIDRILVARYDSESGGYFRRHRDNAAPAVAFRRFALSVNLNTGAYEGGNLLFPEYNDHRYCPQVGEGIIFSASLLHEATSVTAGQRYVLLTFLHDSEIEAQRLAAETGAASPQQANASLNPL